MFSPIWIDLKHSVFLKICQVMFPQDTIIDPFASALSSQLTTKYCSELQDPPAWAMDAVSFS